ncbi:MAG: lipoate--protein ligase family protein [Deltaproteobacteria bacterium]|nr:lipoate--protein ligase family protein [Deltaproteobacteria bacterium]
MKPWRLLDTGMLPGPLNMAIDQALFEMHAAGESLPTLRFYQWQPPAVSLGYFQKRHGLNLSACRDLGIDVVQRPTGGRAVLHVNDLTYSVIAGAGELPFSLPAAYGRLCEALLAGFRMLGFEAAQGDEKTPSLSENICFMHPSIGDIVFNGKKFIGSAQTWQGTSLLQHGSIVLRPQGQTWEMISAPDTATRKMLHQKLEARTISLQEILGRIVEPDEVKAAIKTGMTQTLGAAFQTGELCPEEWVLVRKIASRHQTILT